jgi:DNA adenine methylase
LDPPYFAKGQDLYLNAYSPDDHRLVRDTVVEKLTTPWMVSYDNVPEIRKLYRGIRQRKHYLSYSAFEPRDGTEILFFSENLKIPSIN